MAYKNFKKHRDRHKIILRRLRYTGFCRGDFEEEYALMRHKLFFRSGSRWYADHQGYRFIKDRYQRFWRRQGKRMCRYALSDMEKHFESENPYARKGEIWWIIR